MKKTYIAPDMEIVKLNEADIIATSFGTPHDNVPVDDNEDNNFARDWEWFE